MNAIIVRPIRWIAAAFIFAGASLMVGVIASKPEYLRYIGALAVFLPLFAMTLKLRERIIYPLIIYLALVGLLRRLIIPIAGWSGYDPLLVVGPIISLVLGFDVLYKNRNETLNHPQPKWVMFLIMITVLQIANPFGGSVFGGLSGSMFLLIPWIWYCIAYFTFDTKIIVSMLSAVQFVGLLAAGYGIYQTFNGYLPFELEWLVQSGYAALNVGGILRAISTFPSAAEYAYFCMATAVISFARLLTARIFRWFHFVAFATAFGALVLESSRTVMIFTVLAITLMAILRVRGTGGKFVLAVFLAAGLVGLWSSLAAIPTSWLGPAAPFMDHMVSGLTDPMHKDETGGVHIDMVYKGLLSVIHNPIGYGIGSVTSSAGKVAGITSMQTEVDFSNLMVALGAPGILFTLIVLWILLMSIRKAVLNPQFGALASAGLLLGGLTQWLNGGFYAVPIVIWSVAGWLAAEAGKERMLQRRQESPERLRRSERPDPAGSEAVEEQAMEGGRT